MISKNHLFGQIEACRSVTLVVSSARWACIYCLGKQTCILSVQSALSFSVALDSISVLETLRSGLWPLYDIVCAKLVEKLHFSSLHPMNQPRSLLWTCHLLVVAPVTLGQVLVSPPGTHSFEDIIPLSGIIPFVWQSNKAILATLPKILSLRFDLAPVNRDWVFNITNFLELVQTPKVRLQASPRLPSHQSPQNIRAPLLPAHLNGWMAINSALCCPFMSNSLRPYEV